jgi:hypothetical protein
MSALAVAAAVLAATAAAVAPAAAEAPPAGEPPSWSFSGAVYNYVVPEDEDFLLPIVYADYDRLHLEARYNYEERDAGSLFAGWSFAFGDTVSLELIPMLGGVFGEVAGIAPALEMDLGYKSLSFYVESEYVFDLRDERDSFFYAWSELSWQATGWLRVGLTVQRTRLVDSDLDVQRGLHAGVSWRSLEITGYYFNPGGDDDFAIVSFGFAP